MADEVTVNPFNLNTSEAPHLSWSALPASLATIIYRDGVAIATLPKGVVSFNDTGAPPGVHAWRATELVLGRTVASSGTIPEPVPPVAAPLLGWFAGNGSAGADANNQLSSIGTGPCQLFHVFNSFWTPAYTDIGQNFNPVNGQGKPLVASQRLLITIPMCPTGTDGAPVPGMDLSAAPTAAVLQQYFILGQKLVANGCANAVIRLAHECNGPWYAWSNQGRAAYKQWFVAIVEMLRTVPGQAFLIEWNVSGGWAPLTAQQENPGQPFQDAAPGEPWQEQYLGWYPGPNYVDLLGQDTYVGPDSIGLTVPHDESWIPCVYDALVKMAVQLDKPWTTSEYGSNFGTNVSPVVNGVTIDGDAVTASLISAAATVLKGERPASSWDAQIGGWTAATAPPPGFAHVIYNWNGVAPYMTGATGPNPSFPLSDAAFRLAWAS